MAELDREANMVTWLTVANLAAVVPTPGAFVTRGLELTPDGVFILAQAPESAEEQWLEQDMAEGRQRLHGAPVQAQHPEGQQSAPEGNLRQTRVPAALPPLLDGHPKGYYLGWGIADWAIAGNLWVVGLVAGIEAIALATIADSGGDGDLCRGSKRDSCYSASVALGALAIGSGVGGGIVAVRGGRNIHTYREMRLAQRAP
jgi:hypothetical protein